MTRIALAASSYLPRRGGVEEHVSHVARELRDRGHDVVVWTVDQGDSAPVDDHGVPVVALPCPLPNRSVGSIVRWAVSAPRAAWKWWRAYREFRPEIIDIQCFGPNGTYATLLSRITRAPLVYSNHGETFMDAHDSFRTSALLRRSLRATLARADAVTSCSQYAAEDLEQYGLRDVATIVANAVDSDVERMPVTGLPSRYIVGVGRLVDNKGFHQLLEAFASAAPRLGDAGLVIAGDGPDSYWLHKHADELGIAERVNFTGALTRGQVAAVLDGALVHVVPSHVEAFGIVILEGWRAAVPVVATTNGGPPEFMHDGKDGLLRDPYKTERLGDLLVELSDDDDMRARIGAAGHARLPEFTWSTVTDRYDAVFANVFPASPTLSEVTR